MASRRSPIAGTSRFRGGIRALEHARTRPHNSRDVGCNDIWLRFKCGFNAHFHKIQLCHKGALDALR